MTCHLCGYHDAPHPLILGEAFTARSQCRAPWSDRMCDRCHATATPGGIYTRVWLATDKADKPWSLTFTRSTSWLLRNPRDLTDPTNEPWIGPVRDEGKGSYPELLNRPRLTRIREWLLSPPKPPFAIAVATSGQKHVLPFTLTADSRDYFPVQFETSEVWVDRSVFAELLGKIEGLLAAGWSKDEVRSWQQQRTDRSVEAIALWFAHGTELGAIAPSPLFQLACHVAQRPELIIEEKSKTVPEPTVTGQLSLF